MEADAQNLSTALLRWANSFPLNEPIDSWKRLQDGQVLWKMLESVDSDYFTGDLPESGQAGAENWIPRWQNLKHVERTVINFIRDECGELEETTKTMNPDLKAIAIDGSEQETKQLLKAVLLASMYSPKSNQQMVKIMTGLGVETSAPIANWIQHVKITEQKLVEAAQQNDVDSDVDRISSPEPERGLQNSRPLRDPELENEEKLIKAYASIQDLEQKNSHLVTEIHQLRENVGKLESDLTETRYQLERGAVQGSSEEVDELHQRTIRDRDYIAELENEIETTRSQLEAQERQMERLRMDSAEKERLKEELNEVQLEKNELAQKAKATENLRKKIQTLQDSDKNNQTLRQELETARQDLKTLEVYKNRCLALQKANEEHMKLIQNGEQEIFDARMTRKKMDHEMKMLSQRYEATKERAQRDSDIITELQGKVRDLESGVAPVRATDDDPGSLNDEFSNRDAAYKELKQKCDALEAEITRMRSAPDASDDHSEIEHLNNQVSIYKDRIESLQKQYMDTLTENLGLADKAQSGGEDGDGETKPFLDMRERLKDEVEKVITAEKKMFDLESELSELRVKNQEADAKLSAVGKAESEALDALKKSASLEQDLLKQENERLREYDKKHQRDLDELRALFRLSLVDRGARSHYALDSSEEFKLVKAQIEMVLDDKTRFDEVVLSTTNRIEKGRDALAEAQAEIEQSGHGNEMQERLEHEETIAELREQLQKAEDGSAKSPIQENLQRQLNLMTSAWYDITRRIQSDAVVVQRRNEAPKSFLNRQRKLLNNPIPTLPQHHD